MTTLHQIQLRYVALEDRALLKISTTETTEFRFWVTRRYASLLQAALSKDLKQAARAQPATPAPSAPAVLAFQRDAALAKSDFKTAYEEVGKTTPLGEEPVLLARIAVARQEGDITVVALHPQSGQGIEVKLNDTLIHSLLKLIEDAARAGDWGLPSALPEPPASSQPPRMN